MHKYILTFDPEYDMLGFGEVSLRYWEIDKELGKWYSSLYGLTNKGFQYYEEMTLDFKPVLGIL